MRLLVLFTLLSLSWGAQASRLIEIEDYYSQKTSNFIKARYPRHAFSVYVKAEGEQAPQARELANTQSRSTLNLPYLDGVSQNDVDFWDRKDLSLGTMISYLRSVFIKVDMDYPFTDAEMENFKSELFAHLKLSETYDRIDIKKRQWQPILNWKEWGTYSLFGLAGLGLFALLFFVIFQTGVSKLIKGLSQPLSEIGRSAENVANSSQLSSGVGTSSFQLANQQWAGHDLSHEKTQRARNEIERLSQYFQSPDAQLIYKLEELGSKDPMAMGAIFSEMAVEDLKSLIVWAKGDWWRQAVTQMTPLTAQSLDFIDQLAHLWVKRNLLTPSQNSEEEALKMALARLETKQFGELFKQKSFQEVEAILRLLPQDNMIAIGKYLYPGQWAELLASKAVPLKGNTLKQFKDQALKLCPLKSESEVAEYFREAELLSLLDRSKTKDERDIYRALEAESWIKKQRRPFYSLFQEDQSVLETLATDIPLELWALALTHCDRQECDQAYQHFTARQKYLLREFKNRFQEHQPSDWDVVKAKKQILALMERVIERRQTTESHETPQDAVA
jgi:hypothetical protein